MKSLQRFALAVFTFGLLASCSSVRVISDYDQKANFNNYSLNKTTISPHSHLSFFAIEI